MTNPDVSVVIVNWNTLDILRDCLESVYDNAEGINVEVIVIDNASTDGSVAMIKTEFPQARSIENQTNRGFAAANNQGMKITKGRYILLLNSDTLVLDNAIHKTVEFADSHPEAAVIGCRVLNPDRSMQPTCFMFPSLLNLVLSTSYLYKVYPKNKFLGRERMSWWQRDDTREVDVVTGCFMLVRKETIEQVGLMDESFFMYGEETDWCYRFKKMGWEILFTPEAEIIHLGGASSRQVRVKSIIQLRLGILQFLYKNKSYPYFIFAGLLISLWLLVRMPAWAAVKLALPADEDIQKRFKAYFRAYYKVLKAMVNPRLENFKA